MSLRDNVADNVNYADTKYSSGDSNDRHVVSKLIQEENNNQVDELSKELSEMGCVVDAMKRPNICVENCVYDGPEVDSNNKAKENNDDAYSDEFEDDDKSDSEVELRDLARSEVKSQNSGLRQNISLLKFSKSQMSMSNRTPVPVSGKSSYGSLPIPHTRRINMSFTNDRLREIERHNGLLLNKIISARNNKTSSIPGRGREVVKYAAPASVHRKRRQTQIDHDNMILLRKIQRAKSSSCSIRR